MVWPGDIGCLCHFNTQQPGCVKSLNLNNQELKPHTSSHTHRQLGHRTEGPSTLSLHRAWGGGPPPLPGSQNKPAEVFLPAYIPYKRRVGREKMKIKTWWRSHWHYTQEMVLGKSTQAHNPLPAEMPSVRVCGEAAGCWAGGHLNVSG